MSETMKSVADAAWEKKLAASEARLEELERSRDKAEAEYKAAKERFDKLQAEWNVEFDLQTMLAKKCGEL